MAARGWCAAVGLMLDVAILGARTIPSARIAVLLAEERGASDPRDLATLRAGVRNPDGETARAAIRALGRLGRPALVPDIAVALKMSLPEVRAEAADAIASAFSRPMAGAGQNAVPGGAAVLAASVAAAQSTLLARLAVEDEPGVRAAICEGLARLPYSEAGTMTRVEAALLGVAHSDFVVERLGVAKALESLIRLNAGRWSPGAETVALLRGWVGVEPDHGGESPRTSSPVVSLGASRDARVRRLALEALISAGKADQPVVERCAIDADPQVRLLAMRAAGVAPVSWAVVAATVLHGGQADAHPLVRMGALRGESVRAKGEGSTCRHLVDGFHDPNVRVVLAALELLRDCGAYPDVVGLLVHAVNDLSDAAVPRGWHRAAQGLVTLSKAAPSVASAALGQFAASSVPLLRAHAARAAIELNDRATLEKLAADRDDHVAQIAGDALDSLGSTERRPELRPVDRRPDLQPVDRRPDLQVGRSGSADRSTNRHTPRTDIDADALERLGAPRARVTIRGVGSFELALFTTEAPATALRFVRLADAGYFNGRAFGGVLPTLVGLLPRGTPAMDDIRSEISSWPHVRGAVGLSPGGQETGDAKMFIDLVDNPAFDHVYPVFAQVLNGIDVLDQILEGDVIERVEILSGP